MQLTDGNYYSQEANREYMSVSHLDFPLCPEQFPGHNNLFLPGHIFHKILVKRYKNRRKEEMQLTAENYYSQEANREYMSVSQFKDFSGTYGSSCMALCISTDKIPHLLSNSLITVFNELCGCV